MGAIFSFCPDMDIHHGILLAQGLMDYLEAYQTKEGDDIKSACTIPLPFPVKPDFPKTSYLLRIVMCASISYVYVPQSGTFLRNPRVSVCTPFVIRTRTLPELLRPLRHLNVALPPLVRFESFTRRP